MITRLLLRAIGLVLALAVGIALGAGVLADPEPVVNQPVASEPAPVEEGISDDLAAATLTHLNTKGLKDTGVAIVALPGADTTTVDGLADAVTAARGTVTTSVSVGTELTDPTQKMLVNSLGEQLAGEVEDRTKAESYELIGHLLGHAIATDKTGIRPVDEKSRVIRQGLTTAGFVHDLGLGAERAPAVLVVTGEEMDDTILAGVLTGLADTAQTVVVSGPTDDAAVALARDLDVDALATFDGNHDRAGHLATVTVVIASLARSARESGGDFGASGSDGSVPLG